jgi:RNA polymerase sigma-70 factor, ECF subfamily
MHDDQNLLQEIGRLQAGALARVFDCYAPALYRYAYRHSGNARLADQAVGDVFARLLELLARGRGPRSNLRAYLFEIAYHLLVDEVRHARRLQPLQTAEMALPAAAQPEQQLLLEAVQRAIRQELGDDQHHVIVLRFFEDFSLQETARIMRRNVGSVKMLQQRAVAALRQALERQERSAAGLASDLQRSAR